MSSITIHDWQEVDKEGDGFEFVKPENHPTWWAVRRWWYRGPRAPYVSCTRVDYDDYQVYVDGTTPLMNLKIGYDGSKLVLSEERDIRRILICKDLGAVNRRETDEYLDIEYVDRYGFVVRLNGLPEPIVDIPPSWIADPTWVIAGISESNIPFADIGGTLSAACGDYIGGMPPLNFRARWQVRDQSDSVSSASWINNVDPLQIITIDNLQPESWWPADYKDIRFMNQIRDTNPETGSNRTTNKFANWVPIFTPVPLEIAPNKGANWVGSNVYEVGERVEAKTAEFVGGVDPVRYQARIQKKDDTRGPTNEGWTSWPWQTVANEKVSFFFDITETGIYRFQSQAIDGRNNVLNSYTGEKTAVLPVRSWGTITPKVFGQPYDDNTTLTVLTHDPIDISVSYTGDAVATCAWSVRNNVPVVFGDPHAQETTATFSYDGMNVIMWTLHDDYAQPDAYMAATMSFYAVDARDLPPEHPLLNR